eukprot:g25182.t1
MAQVQAAGIKGIPGGMQGIWEFTEEGNEEGEKGHEIALAEKIRMNPKRFVNYIKGKRITRERVGPLKDQSGHVSVEQQEIGGIVNSEEGYRKLQQDLDQLGKWAEKWQMEFNMDKHEVLYSGKSNQ